MQVIFLLIRHIYFIYIAISHQKFEIECMAQCRVLAGGVWKLLGFQGVGKGWDFL